MVQLQPLYKELSYQRIGCIKDIIIKKDFYIYFYQEKRDFLLQEDFRKSGIKTLYIVAEVNNVGGCNTYVLNCLCPKSPSIKRTLDELIRAKYAYICIK